MLSAHAAHVAKCAALFLKAQADLEAGRALPGPRMAPAGPPDLPGESARAASDRRLAAWAGAPLPVPPPPAGLHRRFTRSLHPSLRGEQAGETGEGGGGGGGVGEAVPAAEDAAALQALTAPELMQANEDARRAFWEGNTLVPTSFC